MNVEREIRPPEVAAMLGRSVYHARRLMRSGAIRSWIETRTDDGRAYRVTVPSEVERYQLSRRRESLKDTEKKPEFSDGFGFGALSSESHNNGDGYLDFAEIWT